MSHRIPVKKNLFDGEVPSSSEPELFITLIEKKGLVIEKIVSSGHSTPEGKWLRGDFDEWVLLISGEAIIEFDHGGCVNLSEGDYLNIPAGMNHRLKETSVSPPCFWLAVNHI